MLRLLAIFLFSFTLPGCKHIDNRQVRPDSPIVFISEFHPCISDTLELFNGQMTLVNHLPAIQVISGGQIIDYDDIIKNRRAVLNGIEHLAILRVRINTLEQWDILIHAGDTIDCRYEDGLPFFTLKNGTTKFLNVNYDNLKRKRYRNGRFMVDTEYNNPTLIYLLNNPHYTKLPSLPVLKDSAKARYELQLNDESSWLDSLYYINQLDSVEYRFYKSRNHYQRLNIELENKTKEELKNILSVYCDSTYRNDFFLFYRNYCDKVARKYYYNKTIQLSNGSDYDFKDVYQRIEQDTLLRGRLRDVHLSHCFRKIDEIFSIDDGKKYYDKVIKTIADTALLNPLHRDYDKIYAREITYSDDLILQNTDGVETTLQKVLAANAGKVIYVDFWASWCAPCMAEMPASKKLREEYKTRDAVFVYLAFNDNEEAWKAAIHKAALNDVGNVYLVTNPRTSKVVDNLRLKTIPRYLIYNKKGLLINSNAPRPESEEIRNLLNKYL